jgi:pescadillo
VDYKVMSTFLEFYRALLKFVNFKLFTDLGQKYFQLEQNCNRIYLDSVQVQAMQRQARKKFEQGQNSEGKNKISEEFKDTPEMRSLKLKQEQNRKSREQFSKCTFLHNRETPVYILQYLILSFGGSFATEEGTDFLAKHKITL